MILESEGVTEQVTTWRTDVVSAFAEAFGLERLLFEAADPRDFEWYIKHYGAEVNLFVDHTQVLLLESVRSGIWGSHSLWNRVVTYKATARRNKLVGQWAAAQMKLTPEETDAYAKAVVQADFEETGDDDVIRKVLGDLLAAGVDTDEAAVRAALEAQTVEARRQLLEAK